MAKTKKGNKIFILEMEDKKFEFKDLEKTILKELKSLGVKYSDDVNIYLNTNECTAYCVVNNTTHIIKIK